MGELDQYTRNPVGFIDVITFFYIVLTSIKASL